MKPQKAKPEIRMGGETTIVTYFIHEKCGHISKYILGEILHRII